MKRRTRCALLALLCARAARLVRAGRPEQKDVDRGRRQGSALLPAAHHRRALGYFKDEGLEVEDHRLRRRLAGVAGGGRRQRRCRLGRVRAHASTCRRRSSDVRVRAARGARRRSRSASRQRGGQLQVVEGSQGQEDRRVGARVVHEHPGQLLHLAKDGLKPNDVSFIGVGTGARRDRGA